MSQRWTPESRPTVHRSFVVQFRGEDNASGFCGRIEYVTSGQATRFASAKELLAFPERVLGDVEKAHQG